MKKLSGIVASLLFVPALGFANENKITFDQTGGITEIISQAKQVAPDLIPVPASSIRPEEKVSKVKKWTVMFYMACDNDTEEWGVYEIDALEAVGSSPQVNIVAQLDRAKGFVGSESNDGDWTGAKRFYITKDPQSEVGQTQEEIYYTPHVSQVMEDLGEVNMANPGVLRDFVMWGMKNYPAERYALIMMSHGTGYRDGEFAVKATNYDDTGGSMATSAIKDALKNLPFKLDLIDFKACLMGMIETAYEIKDYAKYMTATEEMSWTPCWSAEKVMKELVENPNMSGSDISRRIVYHYGDYMDNDPQHNPHPNATYSAIDLVQVEELAKTLDALAGTMMSGMPAVKPKIKEARAKTQRYHFPWHVDLQHFAGLLAGTTQDETLKNAALKVVEQNKKAVFAEYHGSKSAGSRGLAIYFPSDYPRGGYTNSLGFVKNYGWDEFVNKFLERDASSRLIP